MRSFVTKGGFPTFINSRESDFLDISGVGQRKLEVYGEDFIAEIVSFTNEKNSADLSSQSLDDEVRVSSADNLFSLPNNLVSVSNSKPSLTNSIIYSMPSFIVRFFILDFN